MKRAALARLIVPYLPDSLKIEVQEYLLNFLQSLPEPWKPKLSIDFNFHRHIREELQRVAIVSDIIVSLGSINPDTALAKIRHLTFSEDLDKRYILEPKSIYGLLPPHISGLNPESGEARDEFAKNFFRDLVRFDLALSLMKQNPQFSLPILDSLKNDFWIGLSYTVLREGLRRMSGFDPKTEPNPEGLKSRLEYLLNQIKKQWPVVAIDNIAFQQQDPTTRQYRFVKVAELLDRVATAVYIEKDDSRKYWLDYLPYSLVNAGRVLYMKDSTAAMSAFTIAMNLIKELPSPAQEWAMCWNTVVLNKIAPQNSFASEKEASRLLDVLRKNEPWENAIPLLVKQVAVFNPEAALKIARKEKDELYKIRALLAVVNGMNL